MCDMIFRPIELAPRLISLLKVQIGALSKALHSSKSAGRECHTLRESLDHCTRMVARLDEIYIGQHRFSDLESLFDDVIDAYEEVLTLSNHIIKG